MVEGALFLALTVIFATAVLDLGVFMARVNKAQWEAEGTAKAAAQQLSRNGRPGGRPPRRQMLAVREHPRSPGG